MKRVIFFTLLPSPYRIDFFRQLSGHVDLLVIYYKTTNFDLGWTEFDVEQNFEHEYLEDLSIFRKLFNLIRLLIQYRKDVIIIGGYGLRIEMFCIIFCKLFNIKYWLNSDGGFITSNFLKNLAKKYLISGASYWLSSGENTTRTLLNYGAIFSRVIEYPFSSILRQDILSRRPSKDVQKDLKVRFGLDENYSYVIFVGQLIHRKGVDLLIDAFLMVDVERYKLIVVGDGVLMTDLKTRVLTERMQDKVVFFGKKDRSDVMNLMMLSEFIVVPSREDIWGLILNEAIANGLALLPSRMVGAAYSVLEEGRNGYFIDDLSENGIKNGIMKILNSNIESMNNESLKMAKKYTIEGMVMVHLEAFEKYDSNHSK